MSREMEENNFGFSGLTKINEKFRENVKPQNLKKIFGQKSFETSWGFIETLA